MAHLLNNEGGDNTKVVKQTILPDIVFCKSLVHKLSSEGRGKLRDLTKEGVEREVKFALNCGLLSADDNSRGTVEYLLAELEEGGLHFEVGELSGVIFTLLHCPVSWLLWGRNVISYVTGMHPSYPIMSFLL